MWCCFAASAVGFLVVIEGNINADYYIDILRKNLRQSAEKLGVLESFYLYQDNDPKHAEHKIREWLLYNCPQVFATPPQSPDCNPIFFKIFLRQDIRIYKKHWAYLPSFHLKVEA